MFFFVIDSRRSSAVRLITGVRGTRRRCKFALP